MKAIGKQSKAMKDLLRKDVGAMKRIASVVVRCSSLLLLATVLTMFGMIPDVSASEHPVASTSKQPAKKVAHPEVPRIPASEVKGMLEKKADFVIVDTNPADYFELWHIPTAVNIPYNSMDDSGKRRTMLETLPKEKLVVVYCLCEEGSDSAAVALELRDMGYRRSNIRVLEGGLIKWDEAGYPMFKSEIPE